MAKNKKPHETLSAKCLFCNMEGSIAFRIIETYKSIRTSLMFTLSGSNDHAIAITGAEPDVGKSITSANLALSISQTGSKVLLIDCDMRNPSQQKIFEKENTVGLSNILGGMCTFGEAVKRGVRENLDLLTAGQVPPNPSELLGSESMRIFLENVRAQYDFVLLDCPPVGVVSDTMSLLLHAPQTVVVIRQNYSTYQNVSHTVELVRAVGGKILGAVMTDMRAENTKYGHYGYGRYGNGYDYGYDAPGKKRAKHSGQPQKSHKNA